MALIEPDKVAAHFFPDMFENIEPTKENPIEKKLPPIIGQKEKECL